MHHHLRPSREDGHCCRHGWKPLFIYSLPTVHYHPYRGYSETAVAKVNQIMLHLTSVSLLEYTVPVSLVCTCRFPQLYTHPCWTPWWVGSGVGELYMTSKTPKKRHIMDSDSELSLENEPLTTPTDDWPRFIILTSVNPERSIGKLSPFAIHKGILGIAGVVKDVKKQKLKFSSEIYNNEEYNQLFTMEELRHSLNRSRDTAGGPDKIYYQSLKHLSESSLRVLLRAFSKIWQTGQIPSSWQEATIIPIPKPGKDHSNPTNYCPITLTSCICKTMERMVNDRLVWTLERECLISEYQCGFRRGWSTLDHLVRFETFLRNALIRKQHAIAVFFDLEKACDMTWRYGIMRDLYDPGIRGRLPIFIASFLSNRHFRVRIGWGCPRAASSLSPFLALRSTALQTPSPEVYQSFVQSLHRQHTWLAQQ